MLEDSLLHQPTSSRSYYSNPQVRIISQLMLPYEQKG